MPMTAEGKKAMAGFVKEYGKKKGKKVAYATANKKGEDSALYSVLHGGK